MSRTLTNKEFMKILKEACKSEDMDKELNEVLKNYFPYSLTFGRGVEKE